MLEKISRTIGIAFAILWMVFILLEYWQYNERVRTAVEYFQYSGLTLVLLALGPVLVVLFLRFREHPYMQYFQTGTVLLVLSLVLVLICANAYFLQTSNELLSFGEQARLTGSLLSVAFSVYFLTMAGYALGAFMSKILNFSVPPPLFHLVVIALGIMGLVAILFLLGLFGLLKSFILWPMVVLLLFLGLRSSWFFLQYTLWKPVKGLARLNTLGLSALFLLILLEAINFAQVVRPFPLGFDAMAQYVNVAALVSDYEGLVPGFGAYNWSLFMSLGYLIFNQTAVTLCLSHLGTILSMFALYQLSRNWLDANYSLLVVLLFNSLPMISWLAYLDMKVDMGLLFYSLVILSLFHHWLQNSDAADQPSYGKKTALALTPEVLQIRRGLRRLVPASLRPHRLLVIIGILVGFAIGIKFSALIIPLALIPIIGYTRGSRLGFAAAASLMLFAVLFARFDSQAGLRPLHLWADQLQWLLLGAGLALSGLLWVKRREQFRQILRLCTIMLLCSGLALSPWLLKNGIETRQVSISSLTSGKAVGPKPSVNEIKTMYENQRNDQ